MGKVEKGSIRIDGIKNEQDSNKVLEALHGVWGVNEVEISVANKTVTFSYDEKAASHVDFLQAIKDTGLHIQE